MVILLVLGEEVNLYGENLVIMKLTPKLLHSGMGVVSMANSGPHANGSQFFILSKSATHLNYKHTVLWQQWKKFYLEEIEILSVTVFISLTLNQMRRKGRMPKWRTGEEC